jgi:hypothetical protein
MPPSCTAQEGPGSTGYAKEPLSVQTGVAFLLPAFLFITDSQISNHLPFTLTLRDPVHKLLGKEADRVICLSIPRLFWAVGAFYVVFDQTPDEEVKRLLGAPL